MVCINRKYLGTCGNRMIDHTQFCRIKECGGAGCPPPHQQFSKDLSYPTKLYIVGKGIYWRVRIIKNIGKIFKFRDFMSNFREVVGF